MNCSLPERAVHVWYTLAPRELETDIATHYLSLLSVEECARYQRFMQEKDRRQFLLGKVLVRTVLSSYLPLAPREWVFAVNGYGKPMAANVPTELALQFNLSHTQGLVVCVMARGFEVGIDVEKMQRTVTPGLAQRYFAPAEVAYLEQLAEERQNEVFIRFWTLKEAYIKARGMGLSLPLDKFAFTLENSQAPKISIDPALNDDASQWRFYLPAIPAPDHRAAVAARCGGDVALQVRGMEL